MLMAYRVVRIDLSGTTVRQVLGRVGMYLGDGLVIQAPKPTRHHDHAAATRSLTASGRIGAPTGSRAKFTSAKSLPAASGTTIRSNS